jgi:hypothetical protein
MANIEIVYTFEDPAGGKFTYPILIDRTTGCLVSEEQLVQPGWTALENCQCRVCPLTRERHPHCPIAVNIHGLVEYFKDFFSTDKMRITVVTEERTYFREAPAQKGLASILGVVMATSGCPVMDFLRPMAKYHLPFSSSEETIIRSTSMYLLAQYFVSKKGGKPDISLEKLNRAYDAVQLVNEGMCERIATVVHKKDATSNAVIILHTLSQLLGMAIEAKLDSLEPLFEEIRIADDCRPLP